MKWGKKAGIQLPSWYQEVRRAGEISPAQILPDVLVPFACEANHKGSCVFELVIRAWPDKARSVVDAVLVRVFEGGVAYLLGSKEPWKLDLENYRTVWQRDLVRAQMERIGLRTPEQLLARQLASQRTAFAIAGDGPIQSDYWPVLEYEAPKAFYMGITAAALREYDERTKQMALMPRDKYGILSALDDEALRPIFAEYDSANPELTAIMRSRLSGLAS